MNTAHVDAYFEALSTVDSLRIVLHSAVLAQEVFTHKLGFEPMRLVPSSV